MSSAVSTPPRPDLAAPNAREHAAGAQTLEQALAEFAGRIAVVSSFGSQSAVLLAMVAEIEPATPVLFLDTGMHFPQTLDYRRALQDALRLSDVRDVRPSAAARAARDPEDTLHAYDTDACCALRKVETLAKAIAPFAAWVTGRRRAQAATRAGLRLREQVDGRTKVNPLAFWSAAEIEAELTRRRLPRHPLTSHGYASIGCAVCTQAVAPGADLRSGRWAASAKTECGIHTTRS